MKEEVRKVDVFEGQGDPTCLSNIRDHIIVGTITEGIYENFKCVSYRYGTCDSSTF